MATYLSKELKVKSLELVPTGTEVLAPNVVEGIEMVQDLFVQNKVAAPRKLMTK